MSNFGGVVFVCFLIVLYFLPAIVAHIRNVKHPLRNGIGLLNIFLGWTLVGWLAALIWAETADTIEANRQN